MTRLEGRYYAAGTSRSRAVSVAFHRDGSIVIEGEGVSRRLRREELRVSPRLGRTPRVLGLPGGDTCEVPDDACLDAPGAAERRRPLARLAALEERWPAVAVAVAASVAFLTAVVVFGIPELARSIAQALPVELDAKLGEGSLDALDRSVFSESSLDEPTRERLRGLFDELLALERVEPSPRLAFRAGGRTGANAFALPSGLVILTDELVALAETDAQIAAVLAHELGHVAHRHALRSVLQNAGVAVLVAGAVGDFGGVASLAAAVPTLLVELGYSRRFEIEADAHAVRLLLREGRSPEALADILESLAKQPGRSAPGYLSTHPPTEERLRAIRDARRGRRRESAALPLSRFPSTL